MANLDASSTDRVWWAVRELPLSPPGLAVTMYLGT